MARILIADDERLVREMLDIWLTRTGHDVLLADTGLSAINILEKENVDIAIVDIVMPRMDGLETILEIKKKDKALKIIAISGGSRIRDFDFLKAAETFGADATLHKPLDNMELNKAIEVCLHAPESESVSFAAD